MASQSRPGSVEMMADLPARLAGLPLEAMLARSLSRHPGLLARLGWSEPRTVLVEPRDLPFAILIRCSREGAALRTVRKAGAAVAAGVDARIRGALPDLLALVSGGGDGDAQFFARRLAFDGDTEIVLALRNALEDADIDPLADLLPLPAAAVPPLRTLLASLARASGRIADRLGVLERLLEGLAAAPGEEG
ncbi:MAG: SCP2 domain-containing protein [Rhodothalassiaceae bacterium]